MKNCYVPTGCGMLAVGRRTHAEFKKFSWFSNTKAEAPFQFNVRIMWEKE